jgi:hypothetical protein
MEPLYVGPSKHRGLWQLARAGGNDAAPDALAQKGEGHQSLFQLRVHTPRRLVLITRVQFVFSTSQYFRASKKRRAILDRVLTDYLANPVHSAHYIGCSFADEAMNGLLREAASWYPGRMPSALLQWPEARQGREPTAGEMEAHAARYVQMGVQPAWVDDYAAIPDLIRRPKEQEG